MMDSDSAVVPFSAYVWKTTRLARSAWTKFYVSSSVLFVANALLCLAGHWLNAIWMLLLPLAIVLSLTIYFRLLGRLAWVLDQMEFVSEEEDEE